MKVRLLRSEAEELRRAKEAAAVELGSGLARWQRRLRELQVGSCNGGWRSGLFDRLPGVS